jgi:serine O-acetyltransferase
LVVYRFGRWRYGVRPALLRKFFSLIYKILFKCIQIVTGIELPCEVPIGRNFIIDHFGGIIISEYATFGDDCRIRQGVTVGLKNVNEPKAPVIGNNVEICAGAKVMGGISIGNNVVIGANAVVITDIPDDSIAVGIPATIKPRRCASDHARRGTLPSLRDLSPRGATKRDVPAVIVTLKMPVVLSNPPRKQVVGNLAEDGVGGTGPIGGYRPLSAEVISEDAATYTLKIERR